MSIVSSTYTVDSYAQADGRKYVTEKHIDTTGVEHTSVYLADPGADYQAIMEARAIKLAAKLAEAEAEAVLNG